MHCQFVAMHCQLHCLYFGMEQENKNYVNKLQDCNCQQAVMQMRPFLFAEMKKIRDFKVDFFRIFGGNASRLHNGEGLRVTLPNPTPSGLRDSRASLGTFGPSICPT